MEVKTFMLKGFERSLNDFSEQYGLFNLNRLKVEVLKDFNTLKLYNELNLVNTPTAEQLLETATKIEYIAVETFLINNTPKEFEKRLDYLYYSAIIIFENWMKNQLPLLKISYNDSDLKKEILEEAVWYKVQDIMKRLNEIYDELEKNFK